MTLQVPVLVEPYMYQMYNQFFGLSDTGGMANVVCNF
jgi:hypothetical protein